MPSPSPDNSGSEAKYVDGDLALFHHAYTGTVCPDTGEEDRRLGSIKCELLESLPTLLVGLHIATGPFHNGEVIPRSFIHSSP